MGKKTKPRKKPANTTRAPVALNSPTVVEDLPLPLVYYPNHYGTFLAFAAEPSDEPVLCSCCKSAVQNYLRIRSLVQPSSASAQQSAPLGSIDFPNALTKESLEKEGDPLTWLRFEPGICHRCLLATPSLRFCVSMYGGQFKQMFGWYINQSILRSGLSRWFDTYLADICPQEIREYLDEFRSKLNMRNQLAQSLKESWTSMLWADIRRLDKATSKLQRKIWNIFENETRQEFGHRAIGDAWVSESILYQIVRRLFPGQCCERHVRPLWLEGLELDIFVPVQNLGVEYQGQQHFRPVEHWGGRKALDALQNRDARKAELCRSRGVTLVTVDFTEPLTEEYVRLRIDEANRSRARGS